MNKILLKLRIMVSFLYLNWKKTTIFCKIITTIFFLVSKMKQKKQQNYSYLKKYQITTIIIIINISLPTHARYIKYWKIVKQILKTKIVGFLTKNIKFFYRNVFLLIYFFSFFLFFPFMISKMWIKKNFGTHFSSILGKYFFSHSPLFTTPSHCLLTNPNWIRNYTPPFKIIINIKIAKQIFFSWKKK